MFIHNIDPVLLSIGPFHIRYYGINYALALLIFIFLMRYLIGKYKMIDLTKDDVTDLAIYVFIGLVLGARLTYAIVYNFKLYMMDPIKIFYIWQGGMSYHGGLIGGITAGYIFARKKGIPVLTLSDAALIPISLSMFLGRITNFINGELVGRVTDLPWGVNFGGEMVNGALVYRHPSQLYEAAKNLLIFCILIYLYRKAWPSGFLTSAYIFMFGSLRFLVEFFRMPDQQVGYLLFHLTMGQWLCIPMVFIGIGGMIYCRKRFIKASKRTKKDGKSR